MAGVSGKDFYIEIATVDRSSWFTDASVAREFDTLEDTTFSAAAKTFIAGLESGTASLALMNQAADAANTVLWPLTGTIVAFKFRASSAAKSATNPDYDFSAILTSLSPIAGAVGGMNSSALNLQVTGAVTRTE